MRGTDATSRIGIAAVDTFFSRHNWLFREQPIHDYGIDAQVEPKKNDRPTGQLIALQIKTGESWFSSENKHGVRHSISDWHFDYWLRHQLPVFIILHDPDTGATIWQKVARHLIRRTKKGNYYIRIPRSNILDESALARFEHGLAGDATSFRRSHLALDYALMRAVQAAKDTYLDVLEMNHKSLNMRGAWFRFEEKDKVEADVHVERWRPHSDIHSYMAWAFPWLDYEHIRPLQDRLGAIEGETHRLAVKLSKVGTAFTELENFYINGVVPKDYEVPYDDDEEMDEDEYADWAFQRAMDNE